MKYLQVRNLSVTYQSLYAVKNVSFDVNEGDYFCIVGSNGSGKSSLVKALLSLIASEGEIKYNIGREHVAYLPQINAIPHDFPATAREIVLTGTQKNARRLPFYTQADRDAQKNAMKLLEIADYEDRRVGELSGGQLQRVLLARALCRSPKLLILDEPCAGLDENITDSLYEILANLNRNNKVSILMVSHDLDEVRSYAKQVAVMDHSMVFCGSAAEWNARYSHSHPKKFTYTGRTKTDKNPEA